MYWSLENVPWTNLHDLNLDWIVNTMKQTVEQWIAYRLEMDGKYADFTTQINEWKTLIETEFKDLQTYVQDYFDNLDLNESTRYVINQMIASGEFVEVLEPSIVSSVEQWLTDHITPTTPAVDNTLSITGAAADAKAAGDAIRQNADDLLIIAPEISSSNYTWQLQKTINVSTGDVTNNASTAITERFPITPNSKIYNLCDNIGMNNKPTVCNVAFWDYDNETFILRTNILNGSYITAPNNARDCVVIYGYLSSSGNTVTQNDIDEHFKIRIVSYTETYADIFKLNLTSNKKPLVQSDNYATLLPDLNNVKINSVYRLNFALGTTGLPLHTPYDRGWQSKPVATLITSVSNSNKISLGDSQIFIAGDGIYTRFSTRTEWQSWYKIADTQYRKVVIVDPDGNGDYTEFTPAVVYGYINQSDTYVYVKRGTYDLIQETKNFWGEDIFDNWTTGYGPISLRNNIHIYCEPGTVLEAHYTGYNANVMFYYSPINFWHEDATIENVTINASRVRYCVHDDSWDWMEHYHHVAKNCTFIIDNRNTSADWTRRLAWGGGLANNCLIEFYNCYFESKGLDGSAYSKYGSMGYHNSPTSTAESLIIVNNCYFADNSTFRLTYYGTSTKITKALVSGCSLGRAMETEAESETQHTNNVQIIDLVNKIRE